ncbi:MAG: hypothetical protein R2702_12175 [Acidimicrobiales bacterium]
MSDTSDADERVVDQEPAPPPDQVPDGDTADPGGDSDPSSMAGADPEAPGHR